MTKHTPSACLAAINITASNLENTDSLEEEFRIIKKVYHLKILKEHPDKGGDPATFRETRAAFEVLRNLYQESTVKDGTFTSYLDGVDRDDDIDIDELYEKYATSDSYPSYSYYEEAAATPVPGYRVELAKSNRSQCKSKTGKQLCGGNIQKNSIRVGSLDEKAGSYGRWHHLTSAERRGVGGGCRGWRVPKKVHHGLGNPSDLDQVLKDLMNMEAVLLSGLASLDGASQREFAWHCSQEENWAGSKRKIAAKDGGRGKKSKTDEVELVVANASLSEVVEEDQKPAADASSGFSLANPDSADSVHSSSFLEKHSFLIAGSFPELVLTGSTKAKDAGVGDVRVLIESFGGKVAVRFSKKTSYLIVGKDPSRQRIADAESREVPFLTLNMLNAVLNGSHSFADVESLPTATIESLEGTAYRPGGGVLPPIPAATSAAATTAVTSETAKKKPAAAKVERKKPAAKKTAKAKKAKTAKPPTDRESVVAAALAAAAASRNAHRALEAPPMASSSVAPAASMPTSNAMVAAAPRSTLATGGAKARFVIPKPGINGAIAGLFNGKKFVLTGVFPEVGGGSGLSLGKDRMTHMIESFGGKVTGSVSGKTDYLVVGRQPGASKVGKANQRGLPLLDILSLERLIYGRSQFDQLANEPAPRIESFSTGYGGNGLLCG